MNYIIETNAINSIEDHLKCDDDFLLNFPDNQSLYLRLWELDYYCIVLGRSNKEESETYKELATKFNIQIIKRSSGGGTVILGPGCLCYSLFAPTSTQEHANISRTNFSVMNAFQKSFSKHFNNVEVNGITDLCINEHKFSGNAQRRLKHATLFHGTFLYDFDLSIIYKFLKHPTKEPEYRKQRSHKEFLTNIKISKANLETLIKTTFQCSNTQEFTFR